MADNLFGYKLDCPTTEPIAQVLLWAPLDLDARRVGQLKNWGRRMLPSGCMAKNTGRTMSLWERTFDSACDSAVQASDAELAEVFASIDHPWIGLFTMSACETILQEIQQFQHELSISDGYIAVYLGRGRLCLRLWVDP